MTTGQLIKDNLSISTKELAKELNMSKESIYKWTDGSQRNPLDRILTIIKSCDNNNIIRYLTKECGGYFIEMPKVEQNNSEICAKAVKEFGEMLSAMSEALIDGKVDKTEYDRIYSEWNDLENVMHAFFKDKMDKLRYWEV